MADLSSGAYGPPIPTGPTTPSKPFAQQLEESYFAGSKPSQDELAGFRNFLSLVQQSGKSNSQIEAEFQGLKNTGMNFAGTLGNDYYQNKLFEQLTNQRKNLETDQYYKGSIDSMGGIDTATQYMASLLTRSGIRDLSEIGERVEKVPQYAPKTNYYTTGDDLQRFDNLIASGRYGQEFVPTDTESGAGYVRPARPPAGEMVDVDGKKYFVQYGEQNMGDASYTYGYLVPAEQTGTQVTTKLINKRTGEQLKQGHDASYIYSNTQNSYLDGEQADSDYTIGGSFAGGNTSLKLRMINGLPVFYSTPGPSSSDMPSPEFMSAALGMASLMFPGIGTAIGGAITGSLGIAASAAVNAAIGTGVLTTIASGGDVKKGVISGLTAYVAPAIASELGNAAGSIFDSPMGKKMFESMSASALRAAALGQDVEKAVLGAAAGEMFNVVTSQIPGFSDIKDPVLRNAISQAVQAGLTAEGGFSDKVQAAALQGAVTMGLSQMKVDGKSFANLTPSQQKIATEFLQSALTGKPLNNQAILESALSEAAGRVKTAISAERAGQTDLSAFDASVGLTKPATPLEDDIGFAISPSLNVPGTAPVSTEDVNNVPRPSLDPATGVVGPPDMGPTIRRESFISDPNQPTRQLAPGFIPGEVPMSLQKISSADPLADEIQRQSDLIGSGQIAPFVQVASSGQVATDAVVSDRFANIERFRNALQPGSTQIWLENELEGLEAVVKRARDAGVSDDVIEETLLELQATKPDFRDLLRANAVKPEGLGEPSGAAQVGDVTKEGETKPDKAGVVSVGESVAPPVTGGETFFGKGSGAAAGFVPFSLVAFDQGTGTTTYDMNNGFSLFLFADGRQKIMDNESKVIIDLTELPPDLQTEVQTRMVAADAAKSAEALQVPAQKPTDTIPVDKTETKPVDVTPPKPVDVTPTKPVDVPPVETKPTEPLKVDTTNIQPKAEDTAATQSDTKPTGDTSQTVTQAGGSTPAEVTRPSPRSEPPLVYVPPELPVVAPQPARYTPPADSGPTITLPEAPRSSVPPSIPPAPVVTPPDIATEQTKPKGETPSPRSEPPLVVVPPTLPVVPPEPPRYTPPSDSGPKVTLPTYTPPPPPPTFPPISDAAASTGTGTSTSVSTDTASGTGTSVSADTSSGTGIGVGSGAGSGAGVSTQPSLTEEQVRGIVSEIKFPAGLSEEDVRRIFADVMTENPGLGISDVKAAIDTALSLLPASASPADVDRTVSTTVGKPSVADNPNTPEDESKPATGVYAVIESAGKKTGEQITSLEGEIAKLTQAQKDAKEAADEQKRLEEEAAKAAEEQGRQRSLLNLGTSILGGAAGAGILGGLGSVAAPTTTALPPLRGLTTGEATKDEFVSPLAAFQKQIGLTQPEQEPKQEEQERAMPYFSYGQPSEVASVLGLQDEEDQMAATGGLITPLMASGGLPVVHYAGKPRMDFRKGAYVQGPGDGQSDDIPAMLADGEFVWPADVVSALGNGSNKAGAKKLYQAMHNIRSKHRSTGPKDLPPPALDSPLSYLSKAKR